MGQENPPGGVHAVRLAIRHAPSCGVVLRNARFVHINGFGRKPNCPALLKTRFVRAGCMQSAMQAEGFTKGMGVDADLCREVVRPLEQVKIRHVLPLRFR